MGKKKLYTILIAVAFMITLICSTIGLFSLQKVKVNFAVADNADCYAVQRKLDGLLGDNLLFMDVKEVENLLKDFHYLEILSVQKQYPNVLNISIKERREIYYIPTQIDEQTVYLVTNEQGFILDKVLAKEDSRSMIELQLEGINILSHQKGQYLQTDDDGLLSTVFEMAKSVNLTDCIKKITVKESEGIREYYAEFKTHSGVKMIIEDLMNLGVDKTLNAFNVYVNILTDYQKAHGEIQSYVMRDERFRVTHNQKEVWTSEQKGN